MPDPHPGAPRATEESPQTLEERLRERYEEAVDQDSDRAIAQDLEAITFDALEELARLAAEVARLTAERDAAEARAARLEEALRGLLSQVSESGPRWDPERPQLNMSAEAREAIAEARRALTEGVDR